MVGVDNESLRATIGALLSAANAENVAEINVSELSSMFDIVFIATGKAKRHVQAIARKVIAGLRDQGVRALGKEGESEGDWILLDYDDVIIHVMRQSCRDYYNLEALWTRSALPSNEN